MQKNIPEIILKANQEDWLNVFFVVSPLTSMIFRMIIDEYDIKPENILLISFRGSDLKMFNHNYIKVKRGKIDSYLEKLFFISPTGKMIINKIKPYNKKFLIYATSSFREVNWTLKNCLCSGHIYIEEGQASYMKWRPYNYSKLNFLTRLKNNWKNRINNIEGIGYFYRDDAHAFIGISNESFPLIELSKKFLLTNFKILKKYYKPIHLGTYNIGLTCADRRLERKDWKTMFKRLAEKMNYNGVIKLHPSFNVPESKSKEIKLVFESLNFKNISLSPNKSIIEIEMLYEKKQIYGPKTSIEKYSKVFGSNFKHVSLY